MSFWSGEKLKIELNKLKIILTIDATGVENVAPESIVENGAFELSLGPEAFLTSDDDNKKELIAQGGQLVIPPGQFGLLITEEKVNIPTNCIGLISIKTSIKFRGLINVSGFHVDSGFPGRLKFAVYNAGSQNIILERKQRVFLLWLSDLDQPTKPYTGIHANQSTILPEDVMRIQGEIASPGQLKKDLEQLETKLNAEIQRMESKISNLKVVLGVFLTLGLSLLAFTLRGYFENAEVAKPQKTNEVVISPAQPQPMIKPEKDAESNLNDQSR